MQQIKIIRNTFKKDCIELEIIWLMVTVNKILMLYKFQSPTLSFTGSCSLTHINPQHKFGAKHPHPHTLSDIYTYLYQISLQISVEKATSTICQHNTLLMLSSVRVCSMHVRTGVLVTHYVLSPRIQHTCCQLACNVMTMK